MDKETFLNNLSARLTELPETERIKSTEYYNEIISDKTEDGMSEAEAVESLGDIDEIVRNIMLDIPLSTLIKNRVNNGKTKKENKTLWIVLAIIGFPVWLSLGAALLAIILAVYVSVWSVIIAFFSVVFAFSVSGLASVVSGFVVMFTQGVYIGLVLIGAGLICASLGILLFKPVVLLTKQLIRFTGFCMRKIKSLFIRKEVSK